MRTIVLTLGAAVLLVAVAATWSPVESAASDAAYVVNDPFDAIDDNLGDNICHTAGNKCTLRAAVQEANVQFAGHPGATYTITLPGAASPGAPPAVYTLTIAGSGENLAASGDLDIKANLLLRTSNGLPAMVIGSSLSDRIFHIIQPPSGPITVTFNNIFIAQGFATDAGSDGRIGGGGLLIDSDGRVNLIGGGVLSNTLLVPTSATGLGGGIFQNTRGGILTLNNTRIEANQIMGGDQAVVVGGGVFGFGALFVSDSSIISNVVTFNRFLGSSTSVSGHAGGLMISCCISNSSMSISNTAILTNAVIVRGPTSVAQFGIGGGLEAYAPITITASEIRGNLVLATGNANNLQGGGIAASGSLLLQNSIVTDNRLLAASPASVVFAGGGVRIAGTGRVLTSTIERNSVRAGGALSGAGGGLSVGLLGEGNSALVDASRLDNNVAGNGGGIEVQAADTALALRNSVVDNNSALTGGGILNAGTLSLTNSTIYSNLAANHGGGLYDGSMANVDSATFNNNTADIDANGVGDGGALYVANGATLFLRDSLLTGDTDGVGSGTIAPECFGDVISLDYNLIAQTPNPSVCNVIGTTGHNLIGVFANVLDYQLLDHGGATPTLALLPGSVAIGAGDPAGCKDENGNVLARDQRGVARIGVCDIGAYEFVQRALLPLLRR